LVDRHDMKSMQALEAQPEYNSCKKMLRVAKWHEFFMKFQGFNDQVTLNSTRGFNGRVAQIGELLMEVS